MNKEITKIINKIEELGYIVKEKNNGLEIVEIYKSIISNRVLQYVIAKTTNKTNLDFLKELYENLKN